MIDKENFLMRWGNEKLVAVFYDKNIENCFNKLTALLKIIAPLPFMFKDNQVNIIIRIGLNQFGTRANIGEAFESADNLLYLAKISLRKQTCIDYNN
ncbi:MAG: diguanylate cyclase [Kangiellaceae bacterium]|jgi:PleD family two-component response regulator